MSTFSAMFSALIWISCDIGSKQKTSVFYHHSVIFYILAVRPVLYVAICIGCLCFCNVARGQTDPGSCSFLISRVVRWVERHRRRHIALPLLVSFFTSQKHISQVSTNGGDSHTRGSARRPGSDQKEPKLRQRLEDAGP